MEVVSIFANLYSIRYQEDDRDEFEKTFDQWNDPLYLEEFFELNKDDLQNGFLANITVEQAVERTLDEAEKLEQDLLLLAGGKPEETNNTLDLLFQPLERLRDTVVLSKYKAYGDGLRSWLRIYALKIEPGYYIVTGSAIKLTPTMNERAHTLKELTKLNRCRDYLQEQGLLDKEGFKEI